MITIISSVSTNPVSSVLVTEHSQIESELSSTESFEKFLTQEDENQTNSIQQKSDTEKSNNSNTDLGTIITQDAAYQKYDFGTKITSESAYQKYAGNVAEVSSVQSNQTSNKILQSVEKVAKNAVSTINDYYKNGKAKVVEGVEKYRNIVERETKKYGLQDYTDLILSLIMQESSGRVSDVMQSSESAGLKAGTIKDPEKSIEQGVSHFAAVFKSADENIPLTLQAYNFGGYFIKWLKKNGLEGYSPENAQAYSNWLKKNYGMTGDPKYVQHVLRYYEK